MTIQDIINRLPSVMRNELKTKLTIEALEASENKYLHYVGYLKWTNFEKVIKFALKKKPCKSRSRDRINLSYHEDNVIWLCGELKKKLI